MAGSVAALVVGPGGSMLVLVRCGAGCRPPDQGHLAASHDSCSGVKGDAMNLTNQRISLDRFTNQRISPLDVANAQLARSAAKLDCMLAPMRMRTRPPAGVACYFRLWGAGYSLR